MGIQFLKYISHILQVFALIFCTGSLVIILFVLFPSIKKFSLSREAFYELIQEFLHSLKYVYFFSIVFLWGGILIHLTTASINPLQSKLYILYILLSVLLTLITLFKDFWIQTKILKTEKSLRMFNQAELAKSIESKIIKYINAYFFLSVVSFLIILVIILINKY